MSREINRHYIGIIKEIKDNLKYFEIDIPQDDIFIEEIEAMKKNDNRTLLDVQLLFTKKFPKEAFRDNYFDYLYPSSYGSAYVNGASYPEILTYDEYKKNLEDTEQYYRSEKYLLQYSDKKLELQKLKKSSEYNYIKKVKELVNEKMCKYINDLRKHFKYQKFIFAYSYTNHLKKIISDSKVKMWSTDQIGWKEFEYIINDDITIYVDTNFGYGSASYFYCNLKYKNINILPYTDIIKYYYVEMTDFIRHTRSYALTRESWKQVFEFVVQKVNMAKHEPELFINWIVNEIEEMMKGIRKIMNSPTGIVETYLEIKPIDIGSYKICRNCSIIDKKDYEVLPNEKVIAFKVEKITGCLYLLENLKGLVELAPVITPYIREIEQMNIQIQPEIDTHIKNLNNDICKLNKDLKQLIKEIEKLSPVLDIHKKNIEALRQLTKKDKGYLPSIQNTKAEYIKGHPECVKLEMEVSNLMQQKNKLHEHINRRDRFLKILQECKDRINKFIPAA